EGRRRLTGRGPGGLRPLQPGRARPAPEARRRQPRFLLRAGGGSQPLRVPLLLRPGGPPGHAARAGAAGRGGQVPLVGVPALAAERRRGRAAAAGAALPALPPGRPRDRRGPGALPGRQRAGLPLLRLAGRELPAAVAAPRPRARGAPVLPARPAAEAGADRGPGMSALPPGYDAAEEERRARQLRVIVDLT